MGSQGRANGVEDSPSYGRNQCCKASLRRSEEIQIAKATAMTWRAFDHVSFALLCFGVVFFATLDASAEELLGLVATGGFWTMWHSYHFSKDPEYRMGATAKRFALAFYALAMTGTLYLIFAPADWQI
jgi:hypothetical protein